MELAENKGQVSAAVIGEAQIEGNDPRAQFLASIRLGLFLCSTFSLIVLLGWHFFQTGWDDLSKPNFSLSSATVLAITVVSGLAGFSIGIPTRRIQRDSLIARENLRQANLSLEEEIAHREAINEKLRHAHQVLSSHVDNSPLAVIHWDADMRVRLWSSRAEEIFGLPASEAQGKTPQELGLFSPRELEFFDNRMRRLLRDSEGRGTVFCRHDLKDGNQVACRWYNSALHNEDGQVYSILSLGLDETQRHRAQKRLLEYAQEIEDKNQALDAALEEANCATQAKSDFLASMSHEIRTPMNGIIGMAGLLMDTDLNPEQRDYARTITSCGEGLLTIINDILDFSKIEAGKMDLEAIEFDLRMTVEDTLDLLAKQAHENGITLACVIDRNVPGTLVGDCTRIRQILLNYLNNALKFTSSGHVRVHVYTQSVELDRVVIRIEVEDTGIGIPKDKTSRLFQSFSQVDASTTRRFGGTGLGLAICKDLAELMGGKVGVKSTEGKGSTFWFTMNLGLPNAQQGEVQEALDQDLQGKKILIAEPDRVLEDVLQHHFQNLGITCSFEANLEDLIERLEVSVSSDQRFDGVILEARLENLRPAELLHRIRQVKGLEGIPIVFLAPRGVDYGITKTLHSGRIGLLRKPIRSRDLMSVIQSALAPELEESAPSESAPIDYDIRASSLHQEFRILVAEDNAVNQKITSRILEKKGYLIHIVANGREVLEALEALKFDLILMDCQMPIMDGYEATALIRQREQADGSRIPILAMTANAMKGDKEKCLESGMDGYLSKPVKPEQLYAALDEYLHQKGFRVGA